MAMRLFLCDDNKEYRLLTRLVLEQEGHQIVGEAADGQEAIDHAPAAGPEVVLLDLNMPLLNGHEALPRLRDVVPDARIIVLTTGDPADERDRAISAGAHGFIEKPDSVLALGRELTAALEAAH
jgi:DNA-binding NarL/FixJ family response regulator